VETRDEIRDAFEIAGQMLLAPDELVESLQNGYTPERVEESHVLQRRLFLPARRRTRLSPSSLCVFRAAHRHGGFTYTFGLRDELLTGWTDAEKRWQTGFLQHHGVMGGAGAFDAHVEAHDQIHVLLGIHWSLDIDWRAFYVASRLSEALASYHYYFLDEMLEPRCPNHECLVDVTRILRLHACNDCQKPENLYFNLSPSRRRRVRRAALEYARQGRRFFRHELAQAADEAADGLTFVTRNVVNHVGNVSDSLHYVYHLFPLLRASAMEPYLASLARWQCEESLAGFVRRASTIALTLSGRPPETPGNWPVRLRWRRRLLVAQDVLLRISTVLAQEELGVRRLDSHVADGLRAIAEDAYAVAADCRAASEGVTDEEPNASIDWALHELFARLSDPGLAAADGTLHAGEMIAAVGYDLPFALEDRDPLDEPPVSDRDITRLGDSIAALVRVTFPRTSGLAQRLGRDRELATGFRGSRHRWLRTTRMELDGRTHEFDEFMQRFLAYVQSRAESGDDRDRAIAARAALEYELTRYRIDIAPDLVIAEAVEADARRRASGWSLPRTVRLVRSTLSLSALRTALEDDELQLPPETPVTYALTVREGKATLVELDPVSAEIVVRLRDGRVEEEAIAGAVDVRLARLAAVGVLAAPPALEVHPA
jgi:hypothetical protein